jgi:hypothetical protein
MPKKTASFSLPLVPSNNSPFVTMRGLLCARWRRRRAATGRVFARDNGICCKIDCLAALVTDRSDSPSPRYLLPNYWVDTLPGR